MSGEKVNHWRKQNIAVNNRYTSGKHALSKSVFKLVAKRPLFVTDNDFLTTGPLNNRAVAFTNRLSRFQIQSHSGKFAVPFFILGNEFLIKLIAGHTADVVLPKNSFFNLHS